VFKGSAYCSKAAAIFDRLYRLYLQLDVRFIRHLNNGHTRYDLYEGTSRFVMVSGGAAQVFGERAVG
jgi:hypothetical protein